jgi:Uma2 family endonuclease
MKSEEGQAMSVVPARVATRNDYPTWSPEVPESELHRNLMWDLIAMLKLFFTGQQVFATGDLLVFYEPGNRRRHVSPDVWVARGVSPHLRDNYLIWEEPRGPEFVIELTSRSTANVDRTTKFDLYRDVLRVREYFLFDPRGEYLEPTLQGFRLRAGQYQPIRPRAGRLPSQVTGLHLEADGQTLRLWNPETQSWLLTPAERIEAEVERAEAEAERAEAEAERAESAEERAESAEERVRLLEARLRAAGIEPQD